MLLDACWNPLGGQSTPHSSSFLLNEQIGLGVFSEQGILGPVVTSCTHSFSTHQLIKEPSEKRFSDLQAVIRTWCTVCCDASAVHMSFRMSNAWITACDRRRRCVTSPEGSEFLRPNLCVLCPSWMVWVLCVCYIPWSGIWCSITFPVCLCRLFISRDEAFRVRDITWVAEFISFLPSPVTRPAGSL